MKAVPTDLEETLNGVSKHSDGTYTDSESGHSQNSQNPDAFRTENNIRQVYNT